MKKLFVLFALALLALPAFAQTHVADGPCINELTLAGSTVKLCIAASGDAYAMTGPLVFRGEKDFVMAPGGYFGTAVLGDPRDGTGIMIAPNAPIMIQGNMLVRVNDFYIAQVPLSKDANVTMRARGETDDTGVAVVVIKSDFLHLANTDRAEKGDYVVSLTARGPETVYWDEDASTPSQFVVRSVSGKRAKFVYEISAVIAKAKLKTGTQLKPVIDFEKDTILRVERTKEFITEATREQ